MKDGHAHVKGKVVAQGAPKLRAREELDWKPTYSSWRDGLAGERSIATR